MRRSKGAEAILEGPHLVAEALRLGLHLEPVLATEEFAASSAGAQLIARLARPPLLASAKIVASLADADSPRGLIAACRLPRGGLEGIRPAAGEIWLFLDHIQDPGNLGALARVAEGLGGAGLLLSTGCAHPNHPRALRASAGSLLRLPLATRVDPAAARGHFAGIDARWIGLEAHSGSIELKDVRATGAAILALGAEGQGLSEATRAGLDSAVTIPLRGRLESLNVTVAAALVLARLVPPGSERVHS
ncbi:MAG: RNA methyltransferase [Thermoanaerobaculia bacterium]